MFSKLRAELARLQAELGARWDTVEAEIVHIEAEIAEKFERKPEPEALSIAPPAGAAAPEASV